MSTELRAKALALFEERGLKRVSPPLREFVEVMVLQHIPGRFFVMPASTTSRYHPPCSNKSGGLVIHTIRNLILLDKMLNGTRKKLGGPYRGMFCEGTEELMIAATILHDCMKSGKGYCNPGEKYQYHTERAAQLIFNVAKKLEDEGKLTCSKETIEILAEMVLYHQGTYHPYDIAVTNPWTQKVVGYKKLEKLSRAELIVYMADLLSSMRTLVLPVDEIDWVG